jgi:ATP-dependent Clp protease adaptor protein ClpS
MGKFYNSDQALDTRRESKSRLNFKLPKLYKVLLFNDDYTTMDFVINILISVFHKSAAEATEIMLDVHKKGQGVCGIYPYDIAVSKVKQVHSLAKSNEFPLRSGIEEA